MKQKICFITGSRAEYGLLKNIIDECSKSDELKVQLVVTGSHLSSRHGSTVKEIQADGIRIDAKVKILDDNSDDLGVAESLGKAVSGIARSLKKLSPDMVILLGDRYEVLAAATACLILNIPISHIHGGEATEGLIDEAIRHSVTKMSYLHFVATEEYRKKVVQLGEDPERVYNHGALGLDSINNLDRYSKQELENILNLDLSKRTYMVTLHPDTLDKSSNKNSRDAKILLTALDGFKGDNFILNASNADPAGNEISKEFIDYANKNQNCIYSSSLGQRAYLSCLYLVDGMIGNSSSGIIEMPHFNKGTINIGDRQNGRICADSVVNINFDKEEIINSINKIQSKKFMIDASKQTHPYGSFGASKKIRKTLESVNLKKIDLKKKFYSIKL